MKIKPGQLFAVCLLFFLGACGGGHWYNWSAFRPIFGDYDKVPPVSLSATPQEIERGRYLSEIAGCQECHASGDQMSLSGGKVFEDEYGEVRAANITPDKEHGTGDWNAAEIIRAMRSSIDRRGRPLSLSAHKGFQWMSDVDARSLVLFLQSNEAVPTKVDRRRLGGIERNSWGLFPMHSDIQGFNPDLIKQSKPAYGRYLYRHVARCDMCHGEESENFELSSADVNLLRTTGPEVLSPKMKSRLPGYRLFLLGGNSSQADQNCAAPQRGFTQNDVDSLVAYMREVQLTQ